MSEGDPITSDEIADLRETFAEQFSDVFAGHDIAVVSMLLAYEGAAAVSLAERGPKRDELKGWFLAAFEERMGQFADIEVALDRRHGN